MMITLYSINLRIMGKPNISLLNTDTALSAIADNEWAYVPALLALALAVKLALDWFLHTDAGLALRATGDNARMIRSFGANTDTAKIIGVSLSNGLVALSGALIAQDWASRTFPRGVGTIVLGLASVIIGEAIFGSRTVFRATLAALLGAIVYRIIYSLALRVEVLDASDLKMITALIVVAALVVPTLRRSMKQKALARKRTQELAGASSSRGGRS